MVCVEGSSGYLFMIGGLVRRFVMSVNVDGVCVKKGAPFLTHTPSTLTLITNLLTNPPIMNR